MDNNNKIEIKHSAFIILPIIALIISVIGELLCFLEGIPLSGRSWMPVFWLITILAIPNSYYFLCCRINFFSNS